MINTAEVLPHQELSAREAELETNHYFNRTRRLMAAGLSTVALFGAAEQAQASISASEGPPKVTHPTELPPSFKATFKTESSSATISVSDFAKGNITILENVGVKMSQKRLERLRDNDRCRTFDGKKYEVWTYGLPGPHKKGLYGRDFRRSEFCWVKGQSGKYHWQRVLCRNAAMIGETPPLRRRVEGEAIFVAKNRMKAKLVVTSESRAQAACAEGGASASGYGYASARVVGSLRKFIRTKGKSVGPGESNLTINIQGGLNAEAWTEAKASAQCSSSEVEIVEEKPPVKPPKPPQPPENKPPYGVPNPSIHRYVNSVDKQCFDNIGDPDGDTVELQDVRFVDANDNSVGGIESGVFRPNPNDQSVQCVMWNSGPAPVDRVWMVGTLNDGRGHFVTVKSNYSFPVLARPQTP